VVIGGLVTSTALTLVVLPVLYEWLEDRWPGWENAILARFTAGRTRRSAAGA
jgi:hypothetical protein